MRKHQEIFCLSLLLLILISSEAFALGLKGKLDNPSGSNTNNKYNYSYQNSTANNRSVLPRKGDIAVIVEGYDAQHVRTAEAMIVEQLASHGYRVVDEAKMKRIRAAAAKAKAARLALEGNVEGILKINASYNAAATVIARVQAGEPVLNEFQLYTGTASAAIMAVTSKGVKLGGKSTMGKQVGYTIDEAQQKAIDAAVSSGMSQMF